MLPLLTPRRLSQYLTRVTLVSRMAFELPEGLQKHVLDTIAGAFKARSAGSRAPNLRAALQRRSGATPELGHPGRPSRQAARTTLRSSCDEGRADYANAGPKTLRKQPSQHRALDQSEEALRTLSAP